MIASPYHHHLDYSCQKLSWYCYRYKWYVLNCRSRVQHFENNLNTSLVMLYPRVCRWNDHIGIYPNIILSCSNADCYDWDGIPVNARCTNGILFHAYISVLFVWTYLGNDDDALIPNSPAGTITYTFLCLCMHLRHACIWPIICMCMCVRVYIMCM